MERKTVRNLIGIIVIVWLVIGVIAVFQRGYVTHTQSASCRSGADVAVTIVAGPLNYAGVNPKVNCHVPQPSK
jgi:hypothetical protein